MRAQVYEVTVYLADDDQTDSEAGKEFLEFILRSGFERFAKQEGSEKWPEDFLVLHKEGE